MNRPFFPLPDDYTSRTLIAAAMFSFAGVFVVAPALLFDARELNGVAVWWKPLKFWLSLGVHFASLAILAQLLTDANRNRIAVKASVFLAVLSVVVENVYITIQAARGRHSHFNYETAFEASMYALMGIGALLLVLAPFVLGLFLAFQRDGDRSGLKLGAILGLLLGPPLTVALAGFMSIYGSHFYGAPGTSDAGGMPVVGWSTTATDMRPAHFVATHLLHTSPLAGYIGDRFGVGRPAAVGATVLGAAAAIVLFAAALDGRAPLGFLSGF